MTHLQLEYIVAVFKEQSFRGAAQKCYVTQPTLSAQIQKLEEELGTMIFERSKSPVKPTRLGEAIIHQAQTALTEVRRIHEIVQNETKEVTGDLKLAVIPTISPYLIPRFLRALNEHYPKLNLEISELTTAECLKALEREDVDAAILATAEDKNKFYQEDLYSEQMLLFVNPSHPFIHRKHVKLNELTSQEMWLLEEGHCLRDEILSLCRIQQTQNKPGNLRLRIGNLEALRTLVEKNFGYTLLPYLSTLNLTPQQKKYLRKATSPVPARTVNLTTKRRYLKQAAIEALKAEIISSLPRTMEKHTE